MSKQGIPRWCPKCKAKLKIALSYMEKVPAANKIQLKLSEPPIILLLDNIRSTYNVGSMLRTADGFNISQIYFCGISATPENQKIRKTSLGAEKINNWNYFENGLLLAQKLKQEGKILLGLEFCSGSKLITDIKKMDPNKSIVLIVGNELMGIDPEIRKICDELVYIPMMGKKSSFNVTIAFGIAAFYLNYICS